jgi:Enoyl-(Acyl carrier protein) reductase
VVSDLRQANADAAADVMRDAGFDVSTATVDVSSRESVHALATTAEGLGDLTGVIHAAGVSPSQATPQTILAVDLYGTALVLEELGNVIAPGGAGVVIASQSGHRLDALAADQNTALETTPADELLQLPMLQPDQVKDPCTPTSWPSEGTRCVSWLRPCAGPSAAPESTPSAPESFSPRSPRTNSRDRAETDTDA